MPSQYATEFTPELDQKYLANILNENERQRDSEVSAAKSEGESAGLIAKGTTGSRISAAEDNADRRENSAVSQFNLDVAGKKYSERMTEQGQQFQDTERQKTEAFQTTMAQMGYQFADAQREAKRRSDSVITSKDTLGMATGFFGSIGAAAAGGAAGRAGKAASPAAGW